MGKKDEQLELIEVKDALAKALEELFGEYSDHTRAKNKANKKAKEVRAAIIEKIKARGIAPDADGVISFRMNGKVWKIEPGESKLNVTNEKERTPAKGKGDD